MTMSDDIETLRRLADGLGTEERKEALSALERVNATLHNFKDSFEREYAIVHKIWEQLGLPSYEELNGRSIHDLIDEIKTDRDSLRKALDDRYAADLKAAKAIFAETGRTSGFPSVKEVVAFYVAEVERLEKELDITRAARDAERRDWKAENARRLAVEDENDSLRAKLDRAKEAVSLLLACPEIADADPSDKDEETHTAERNARAVLSADAPAQQTQISDEAREEHYSGA